MIPIPLSHHRIAWLAARVRKDAPSVTFIVKGTYDLQPGGVATPSEEQQDLTGDLFDDDDYRGLLRYPSDFAPFKPNCDILVKAHAHAPGGKPTPKIHAGIQVGGCAKVISVHGDRVQRLRMITSVVSPPKPFKKIEIAYTNALGGPGFSTNPVGSGKEASSDAEGKKIFRLPNLHYPSGTASSLKKNYPAGFGPIPATWPQRNARMGTYKKEWLQKEWPWFPKDFDWSYFNAAPEDQQLREYLEGNEQIHLENLHPVHSEYQCRLPGVRIRCLHGTPNGARVRLRDVAMNLDTAWIDADEEKLVLVWRGLSDLVSDELPENDCVIVVEEPLESSPKPIEEYQREADHALASMRDEEKAKLEAELHEEGRKSLSATRVPEEPEVEKEPERVEEPDPPLPPEMLEVQRLAATLPPPPPLPDDLPKPDMPEEEEEPEEEIEEPEPVPPPEPEPIDRAWCLRRVEKGDDLADLDLSRVDLSHAKLDGVNFRNSILFESDFRSASLKKADFTRATLQKANFTRANLEGSNLSGADFTEARMGGVNLDNSILDETDFSQALLRSASLAGVRGKTTIFSHAILSRANLSAANLPNAMAHNATLHGVNLEGANLENASLDSAWGINLRAEKANLVGLRASGANFEEGIFREIVAHDSIWEDARLFRADFFGARMDRADFTGAHMVRARLTGASIREGRLVNTNLRKADLVKTNLFRASLGNADLTSADVSRSNLFEADLLDVKTGEARFFESNLKRTVLADK